MNIFTTNPATGVSKFRLYLLRVFYAMAVFMLGIDVWAEIFTREQWEPLAGVAFSFWGAFSLLAIIGVVHPLKMLPLLLVQFSYKLVWLLMVAYPLWSLDQLAGSSAEGLAGANSIGLILDLLIIPWRYVMRQFIFAKPVV